MRSVDRGPSMQNTDHHGPLWILDDDSTVDDGGGGGGDDDDDDSS